mmetsp:Transcript_42226/g.83329  ORF Transcript_42226/g.83329 Transcript_42226/m.83329 type:complete len:230 (+) Transcript_42226:929-1618(+)
MVVKCQVNHLPLHKVRTLPGGRERLCTRSAIKTKHGVGVLARADFALHVVIELGPREVGLEKTLRLIEVLDSGEVRVLEIGSLKRDPLDVGALPLGLPEIGPVKLGACNVHISEEGRFPEHCTEVCVAGLQTSPVCSRGSPTHQVLTIPILPLLRGKVPAGFCKRLQIPRSVISVDVRREVVLFGRNCGSCCIIGSDESRSGTGSNDGGKGKNGRQHVSKRNTLSLFQF